MALRHLVPMWLLLAVSVSGGRSAAVEPLAGRSLRFERLTMEDGLSHLRIHDILQDRDGFLWFATQDGLDRWDGYRVESYRHDPSDPDSISDSYTLALEEGPDGILWIGTHDGGLNRFDPTTGRFTAYRHDPEDPRSLSSDYVKAIYRGHEGRLWIGADNGVNELDPATGTFTRWQHPDLGEVFAMIEGHDRFWIGADSGLYELERENRRIVRPGWPGDERPEILDRKIVSLLEDRDGALWFGSHGEGVVRLAAGGRSRVFRDVLRLGRDLAASNVETLFEDRLGRLWIGTRGGGLIRFDPDTERFVRFRSDPYDPTSLSNDMIFSLAEDRDGLLWIGTNGGVSILEPSRQVFELHRRDPGDPGGPGLLQIVSLAVDRGGDVWAGTFNEGLVRLDRSAGALTRYRHDPSDPGSLAHDFVWAVHEDHRGRLWVGTEDGLDLFDRERGRFIHHRHDPADPASVSDDRILTFLEDRAGRFWVGTRAGLDLFDRDAGRSRRIRRSGLPYPVLALHEDDAGRIWMGLDGGGLERFDPASETLRAWRHDVLDPRSLAANVVSAIHPGGDGRLWIATLGGGLDRFDSAQGIFVHHGSDDGLPSNSITGVLGDGAGRLWLGTPLGLARFDPATGDVLTFDASDGLLSGGFTTKAYTRGQGGELLFGGREGIVAFDPSRVTSHRRPPSVVLSGVHVLGREVSPELWRSGELTLTHRDRLVSIGFAALHFANPAKNRYAFKLEGLHDDWIETDATERRARFANLDPGRYTLRVRASNKDGVWNDDGATLTIVVRPPPWKTAWAWGLYALALAGAVRTVVSAQHRKLERERSVATRERAASRRLREADRLKDEFLANTSHELRTPLFGIIGLAEALIDGGAGDLPEPARDQLETIVASGRRLSSLVNDILDFSKMRRGQLEINRQPVDLRMMADVVLTLSRPLVASKALVIVNAVSADLPAADVDKNRLQQILLNLVGNAVKFTEAGEVSLDAAVDGDGGWLTLTVRDTGVGIAPEHQERIFHAFEQVDGSVERTSGGTGLGLAVTRQLVEIHGGTIRVVSRPGHGSTFAFTLPVASGDAPPAVAGAPEPLATVGGAAEPTPTPPGPMAVGDESAQVLVVDDEPVNRLVLRQQLAAAGFGVLEAAAGPQALGLLAKEDVDLVLLDVMMPQMSGYEVCKRLREERSVEELPVIFLTAKDRGEDLAAGFAAGGNDYLAKPIRKEELLSRVRLHLRLLRTHRGLGDAVEERGRLIAELEAGRAELAHFNRTISHDLRNPIVTLKNFLGKLERDAVSTAGGRFVDDLRILQSATDEIEKRIEALFRFSDLRGRSIVPQELALGGIVRGVAHRLAGVLAEKGAELVVAPDLASVHGDRAQLSEVFRELVRNAIKFAGENAPWIEIATRSDADHVVVTVRDNGIGLQPAYREKIFDLFDQLDPSAEGCGLGLALVRRIVEAHGGTIRAESDGPGRGTQFVIRLPRC